MEVFKIRVKIGENEFDAEGPDESVKAQLAAFMEIVSSSKNTSPSSSKAPPPEPDQNEDVEDTASHVTLEKIIRVSGRIVSLTAIPPSTDDAALLIMLGHKDFRNVDSVTGQEIGDGLAQSGRGVPRTDRIMEKPISANLVLKSGYKRSTRYRLSNLGHQRALTVARELIASLPE